MGAQAGGFEQRGAHRVQRQGCLHMGQGKGAIPPGEAKHRFAAHQQAAVGGGPHQGVPHLGTIRRGLRQQKHRPVAVSHIGIDHEANELRYGVGCTGRIRRPIGSGKLLQQRMRRGLNGGHGQLIVPL